MLNIVWTGVVWTGVQTFIMTKQFPSKKAMVYILTSTLHLPAKSVLEPSVLVCAGVLYVCEQERESEWVDDCCRIAELVPDTVSVSLSLL